MSLLVALNEIGFQSLKNDRETILDKIKDLKVVLKELDTAYLHLKEFYEPEIKIIKEQSSRGEIYMGEIFFLPPYKVVRKKISFSIDLVENYKGEFDERLKLDAQREVRQILKDRFPIYFE